MKLRAYYETIKPERTYANVMTTGAGFLFACAWHIHWSLLLYALLGTTLIVMSACAANNVLDRRLDTKMPRTKKRPTATGELPAPRVIVLAAVLGVAGFAILAVHVNWLSVLLGVIGYVDYVVLYGWAKRTTVHSTLVGTISGAVPIMAGYTAATGRFALATLLLGLIMLFWQMPHFYAIGVYRREDYAAGGLPVWPVVKGVPSTLRWMALYTALYALAVIAFGVFGGGGAVFTVVAGLAALFWLRRALLGFTAPDAAKWARGMFGLSLSVLLILCAAVAFAPLLP